VRFGGTQPPAFALEGGSDGSGCKRTRGRARIRLPPVTDVEATSPNVFRIFASLIARSVAPPADIANAPARFLQAERRSNGNDVRRAAQWSPQS
jgi:hypothetical protein